MNHNSHEQSSQAPRKKLLEEGAQALSDVELVALLLGSGSQGRTTVELAQELVVQAGSLRRLVEMPHKQFRKIKGLGDSKYILFKAGLELSQRLQKRSFHPSTLDANHSHLLSTVRCFDYEFFAGLFLDGRRKILDYEELLLGGLEDVIVHQCEVFVQDVVKQALQLHANTFLIAHYSPTGDGCPKPTDISLAHLFLKDLYSHQVQMSDYLVVSHQYHVSLWEKGFLL